MADSLELRKLLYEVAVKEVLLETLEAKQKALAALQERERALQDRVNAQEAESLEGGSGKTQITKRNLFLDIECHVPLEHIFNYLS